MFPLLIAQRALKIRKKAAATAIERIANRLESALRKRFLAAVEASKGKVDLEALAQAVQSGSATKAELAMKMAEWPERYGELAIDLRAGFTAGGQLAYNVLDGHKFNIQFNYINAYAVDYANRKLPKIVMDYITDARENIRSVITDAVSGKYTPMEAAKEIKAQIGLTPQYARAVARFQDELIATGVEGERLAAKVDRYREKLLKARSRTIARTEIIQAQAAGQRSLWEEAAREGVFDRHTAKRIWRTNHEGETNRGNPTPCPLCAPLNGQEITFGGVYDHPEFGHADVFGEALNGPPLHPNCLCHEELVP